MGKHVFKPESWQDREGDLVSAGKDGKELPTLYSIPLHGDQLKEAKIGQEVEIKLIAKVDRVSQGKKKRGDMSVTLLSSEIYATDNEFSDMAKEEVA